MFCDFEELWVWLEISSHVLYSGLSNTPGGNFGRPVALAQYNHVIWLLGCTVDSFSALKHAAHVRKELSKLPRQAGHVCGEIVVRNSPREAVRIKPNMFDIFVLMRQIPQLGLIKDPIKILGILT